MRRPKLKLDVDELVVESLRMPRALSHGGTVRGNLVISDLYDTVYRPTIDDPEWNDTVARETQWVTCGGTCATCDSKCWA